MDYETKRVIGRIVNAVIDAYNINIPITNIEEVVRQMGGKVTEDSTLNMYSDGLIRRLDERNGEQFEIVVSSYQLPARKNFTIAHELGHLFMHMGYEIDEKLWDSQINSTYYRNGNSEQEYQANEFAATLLMPEDEYKRIMDIYTIGNSVDTSKIADYFNVSVEAAANRGKWLGYLQW